MTYPPCAQTLIMVVCGATTGDAHTCRSSIVRPAGSHVPTHTLPTHTLVESIGLPLRPSAVLIHSPSLYCWKPTSEAHGTGNGMPA